MEATMSEYDRGTPPRGGGTLTGLFVILLLGGIVFLLVYKFLYGWIGLLRLFGLV